MSVVRLALECVERICGSSVCQFPHHTGSVPTSGAFSLTIFCFSQLFQQCLRSGRRRIGTPPPPSWFPWSLGGFVNLDLLSRLPPTPLFPSLHTMQSWSCRGLDGRPRGWTGKAPRPSLIPKIAIGVFAIELTCWAGCTLTLQHQLVQIACSANTLKSLKQLCLAQPNHRILGSPTKSDRGFLERQTCTHGLLLLPPLLLPLLLPPPPSLQ